MGKKSAQKITEKISVLDFEFVKKLHEIIVSGKFKDVFTNYEDVYYNCK